MDTNLIIISGMHRSSTSLITQYIAMCGVDLGDNLIGAYKDNRDGYFENKTIVECHQLIIKKHNRNIFNMKEIDEYPIEIENQIKTEVSRLVPLSKTNPIAFKDPRNSLFISALANTFPTAKHLLIYRHYLEVVDSLIRRGTDAEIRRRPWLAARAWISYNTAILKFRTKNYEKSLLLEDKHVINNSIESINEINKHFHLELKGISIDKIYKSHLTKRDGSFHWKTRLVCFIYKIQLERVLRQLRIEDSAKKY